MSEQIRFLELPVSDISNENFDIEITDSVAVDDGNDIRIFMRNRNLTSSWITTGSDDTANTKIECLVSDSAAISDIFIVRHNFKDFDIDYWNGVAWTPVVSVTNNTKDFYHFDFSGSALDPFVNTTKVRIVIYGTIVPDEDKSVARLMLTSKVESGQLESWPKIVPEHGLIQKATEMLSGKFFMTESLGAFKCKLAWKGVHTQGDVDILRRIYMGRKAVMIWISGGDDTQFRFDDIGYRNEDMYIMKPKKDYKNPYYKGLYKAVMTQTMDLIEVVA